MPSNALRRAAWPIAAATAILMLAIEVQVLSAITDEAVNPAVPAAATSAISVLLVAFGLPAFVRRLDIDVGRAFPWLVGAVSALLSLVPWALVALERTAWGHAIYQGLRVPPGIVQFWDLDLVLRSVDCAGVGVDVYAENNGCLQDPSIYGPGTLWLRFVPFDVFSARYSGYLGVLAILVSSLALVWLARQSAGRGQFVLLVAAAGAPWLLLLERGNFDGFVVWSAILLVFLVRRWPSLWSWSIGAAGIWLMGTWKYYPFALGLMLIPVLRIRRGWIVLAGYAVASAGFVMLTWENFRFSMSSNNAMVELGDVVILGRVPVVARMLGGDADPNTYGTGDLLFLLLAVAAVLWGIVVGLMLSRRAIPQAMLAVGGSTLFLTSVLVAGFGWAYKAVFLLLLVPLASLPRAPRSRVPLYSSIVVLILIGTASVVVWNTVLATPAGVAAAGFGLGASLTILVRPLLTRGARAGGTTGQR